MRHAKLLPLFAAALLGACTTIDVPDVQGGPELALSPEAAQRLGVRHIRADADEWVFYDYAETTDPDSTDWRHPLSEMEFTSTVEEEMGEELRRCATGPEPVDVTVFITRMESDPRFRSLLDGQGADTLGAIVEIVESSPSGRVLGRYFLTVGSRSGNLLERIVGDRLMNGSEELGRELCLQAFGRNPRPAGWRNATK